MEIKKEHLLKTIELPWHHRDPFDRLLTAQALPTAIQAAHEEVLTLVESQNLSGRGIGWIDAHLLASALLSAADFWTLDKRLTAVYTGIK